MPVKKKVRVFNINSHYYCNLISNSLPNSIDYFLIPDYDLKSIIKNPFKAKETKISGWGEIRSINFFIILWILFINSPLITKQKTYFIFHKIFDHFPFVILSNLLRYKTISIFHGRCDVSTIKFIYFIKYLISGIYYLLEKQKYLTRYFIHKEAKLSYIGNTGIVQKPTVINSMNIKARYSIYSKSLFVGNYPERSVFEHSILEYMIKYHNKYTLCGASNKYNIYSYDRTDLISCYKKSFAYISILKEPENYFSLSLLDACDAHLPILCLYHNKMSIEFKNNVILYSNYIELENKINQLKNDYNFWNEYSIKSSSLLNNYFSKTSFIDTWSKLIK